MKKALSRLLAILCICSILVGCQQPPAEEPLPPENSGAAEGADAQPVEEEGLPPVYGDDIPPSDYSIEANWLSLPETEHAVDVFYLYPTAWNKTEADPHFCQIDNETLRAGGAFNVAHQASAFEGVANIYAPVYRQVDALWLLGEDKLTEGQKYFDGIPYTDARAAFEYYIEHYNNGRPFMLAGHSQGANVVKSLLKYYMAEHPEVYERMVCAYIVGYSVTQAELDEFPHLKFAEGASDTGVIVSWNTEAPGMEYSPLVLEGAIAINPITWTRAEEVAGKEQNLGSHLAFRGTSVVEDKEQFADAAVDLKRGSVICSTVDVEQYATTGIFPTGSFHVFDFGLYYENIRENARTRADAFLQQSE